jgi:hypothetical protein
MHGVIPQSSVYVLELRVWYCFAGKKIQQLDAEDVDEIEKLGQK